MERPPSSFVDESTLRLHFFRAPPAPLPKRFRMAWTMLQGAVRVLFTGEAL